MKKSFSIFLAFILFSTITNGQSLLNKLKNKANQEVNKLENGALTNQAPQANNKLSANVTRSVAVTLGSDENFDYQENCIDLGTSLNQVSFIVTKQTGNTTQCFTYKNGIRTAVACPTGSTTNCQTALQCASYSLRETKDDEYKKYITTETKTNTVQVPKLTDAQVKAMQAYMTPAQIEEYNKAMKEAAKPENQSYTTVVGSTIHFNGKQYGPFKMINKFMLTPDAAAFYAEVMEDDTHPNYKIISSATTKTISNAVPSLAFFASADNTEFATYGLSVEDQKYSITTSSGKSTVVDVSVFHGAWFTPVGNHLITYVKDELLLDGKVIRTFEANSNYDPCNLYVSSDSKGVAIVKDNKISFPDGDYYQYPLKMAIVNIAGQTYFKWLALENREVVVYQKPY